MKCLSDNKVIEYLEKELNSVESSMIRDHLILCDKCSKKYDFYSKLDNALLQPELIDPPAEIEENVMKKVSRGYSYISSIVFLISVSFMLLIAGIYIYFDFANDSIIKALHVTTEKTTTLVSSFVNFIEMVFAGISTIFQAINSFIEAVLNIRLGIVFTGSIFSLIFFISLFFVFKKINSLIKSGR